MGQYCFYSDGCLNVDLTWETSEQTDLGLDVEMFNNRLSLSMDYFDKRTFNLIQTRTTGWPQTIGVKRQLINLGEVRNRGFEVSAIGVIKSIKTFHILYRAISLI